MPNVVLSDYTLDNGLQVFPARCDRIYVCIGGITDFASVLSLCLGYKNFGAGNAFSAISNASPSGRQVNSVAFTDGTMTASGTAGFWAAVDFADSQLLAWGPLASPVTVIQGQLFALSSFNIHEESWFANVTININAIGIAISSVFIDSPAMHNFVNVSAVGIAPSISSLGKPTMTTGGIVNINASGIASLAASLGIPTFSGGGANWWGDDGSANAPTGPAQYPYLLTVGGVGHASFTARGSGGTNGTGYPLVFSGGGGSGAAGTVDVVGGAYANVVITNPGQNYTSLPTITCPSSGVSGGTIVAIGCYKGRPPWNVAGVHYAVGIDRSVYPTDANLKDPATIGASGAISRSGIVITVSGNGTVLDGYDLTKSGGYGVSITGQNCTMSNCKYLSVRSAGATQKIWFRNQTAGTLTTITKCDLDMGGINGSADPSAMPTDPVHRGNILLTYNRLMNGYGECHVAGSYTAAGTDTITYMYNIIGNAGYGFVNGAHGDWIQIYNGSNLVTGTLTCNFNLLVQFNTIGGDNSARSQGMSFYTAGGNAGQVKNLYQDYNTVIAAPGTANGAYINFGFTIEQKNTQIAGTIRNNWVDQTGFISQGTNNGCWFSTNQGGAGNGTVYAGTINGYANRAAWFAAGMPGGNMDLNTNALLPQSSVGGS